MGKTAFSGPVYGAKSVLWVTGPAAAATTNASTVLAFLQGGYAKRVVPRMRIGLSPKRIWSVRQRRPWWARICGR
jgi:hypothetical protein